MHWELWIVPVIALFVWIISQFRGGEEPKKAAEAAGEGRRPLGEVEKFLQEIDRMRRKTEEERAAQARAEPPEVIPVAQPAYVVREESAPPPVPRRQQPRTRPRSRPTEVRPATPQAVPAAAVGAPIKPVPVSAVVAQVRELLSTPQSLRAAFLLQQVLGPPRCHQQRRV